MTQVDTGQVSLSAAQVYDRDFLPALFEQWPARVLERLRLAPGARVLDVACGTGVLTRAVAERVGAAGVVGLDLNAAMLEVAARRAPQITWQLAAAESLPFDTASFDCVLSQFGLMFFSDRQAALAEMLRVLKPGGPLAVLVWASSDESPGYALLIQRLEQLFGAEAADVMKAPFCLGDSAELERLFEKAGTRGARVSRLPGTCCFPSLDAWVNVNIEGWTLSESIDASRLAELTRCMRSDLLPFTQPDGSICFDAPALLVTAGRGEASAPRA
jgi:ubiquinone/menaquinone biosynthesis C-methylase UbiE